MSTQDTTLNHHPAPHRDKAPVFQSGFGLLGGPLAWFVQLCVGYALSSWPCFSHDERRVAPLNGYEWTWAALGGVSLAALVVAIAALYVSANIYRRTRNEQRGNHWHLLEVGSGRTRFLALWGMIGGGGFAIAISFTAVGFFILPRCGG